MSLISLLKDKGVMIGSIDVASREVEAPETVTVTIRDATTRLPPGLRVPPKEE